jgi:ABC-type uncharacterized transport system substrate-binding protein
MKRLLFLIFAFALMSCGSKVPKIFYINSYHVGFASNDEIMAGIKETLADKNVELEIFIMDTKRNPDENFIQKKAEEALQRIKDFKPDVIIASDDNAVKYAIAPHFKNGPIPVLFCGVNWSCEQYGLPTKNVTGMLEILPVEEIISTLQNYYRRAKTITVLSENTTSERKNKDTLDPLYRKLGLVPSYSLVNTFAEYKTAFVKANTNADLVFFLTNGAIKDWDDEEAKIFIQQNISKPVFTVEDFIMPFAVIGFTKVAWEQGHWAAQKALDILSGTDIRDIPLTQNKQTAKYINMDLLSRIDFQPNEALLKKCKIE